MEKYVLIYPHQDDWQQLSWSFFENERVGAIETGTLDQFLKVMADFPIIAIVPGIWVNMFSIVLPPGRSAQVKKALPFLLEEQLAQDLEEVHIALPTAYTLGEETPVAVISKTIMQTLQNLIKEKQLNLQQALPDWLCLPLFENTWTIQLSQDHAYVRQGYCLGFSVQKSMLMPMLNLAIEQASQKPQSLHIYHLALEAADMEDQLAALNVPLAYEAVNENPLFLWSQHFTPPAPLNLLQGEFLIKSKTSPVKRLWYIAAGLAAAIVLVQVLQSSLHYNQLQTQYNVAHEQVVALYKKVFPEATNADNARTKLEKLASSSGKGADNPLFAYLQDMSEPLLNTEGVSLQNFNFQEDSMHLEVIVKDFATLSQLEKDMNAKGLKVKQDNAHLEENQVIAQLHVTRG